jgi:threonine dehydratase
MKNTEDVTVENVLMARERIGRILQPTPLVLSEHHGAWLKLENLQLTGSYKLRGAINAIAVQIERGDRRSVVAASAGNHAQAVAWAARHFGLEACVVVPTTAPRTKVRGAVQLGARVVSSGQSFEDALERAQQLAVVKNWRFLHAFNDPDIIAGQGTVALELIDSNPDVVLIPVGGGGLAAGMGRVLKWCGIKAIGVKVDGPNVVADGVRVCQMGDLTSRICDEVLDDTVGVTDNEIHDAMLELLAQDRIVAEGAGALAPAALSRVPGKRKIAIVSGGNVDTDLLFRSRSSRCINTKVTSPTAAKVEPLVPVLGRERSFC